MKRYNVAAFFLGAAFLFTALLTSCQSYPVDFELNRFIENCNSSVKYIQGDSYSIIMSADEEKSSDTGLIFYPGGKVEYQAYLPLMEEFAKKGLFCVLVEMPFDFAFFDYKAAGRYQTLYPEIKHWYLAGHSLGGAMAASYISRHKNDFDGLVLLAAYSTHDISTADLKVLSIYGSNDGVLNLNHYQKYKKNLPPVGKGLTEIIIEGGNHAQFASYGEQKGDYKAEITVTEQQEKTVEEFSLWAGLE